MTPQQAEVSEMSEMRAIPANEPVMVAWEAYKASPEYENTKRWARELAHTDGSLWAAFFAGFSAMRQAAVPAPNGLVERLLRLADTMENNTTKGRSEYDQGSDQAWQQAGQTLRAVLQSSVQTTPAPNELVEAIAVAIGDGMDHVLGLAEAGEVAEATQLEAWARQRTLTALQSVQAASPPALPGQAEVSEAMIEAERLMREFYLSSAYDPKASRPADTVQAAIAFTLATMQSSSPSGLVEAVIRDALAELKTDPAKLKRFDAEEREIIRAEENGYSIMAHTIRAKLKAALQSVQAASPQVREGAELRAAILDQASKDRAAFDALSPRLRGALERQVAALNPTSDAAEGETP